jgi:hypothetical protein
MPPQTDLPNPSPSTTPRCHTLWSSSSRILRRAFLFHFEQHIENEQMHCSSNTLRPTSHPWKKAGYRPPLRCLRIRRCRSLLGSSTVEKPNIRRAFLVKASGPMLWPPSVRRGPKPNSRARVIELHSCHKHMRPEVIPAAQVALQRSALRNRKDLEIPARASIPVGPPTWVHRRGQEFTPWESPISDRPLWGLRQTSSLAGWCICGLKETQPDHVTQPEHVMTCRTTPGASAPRSPSGPRKAVKPRGRTVALSNALGVGINSVLSLHFFPGKLGPQCANTRPNLWA